MAAPAAAAPVVVLGAGSQNVRIHGSVEVLYEAAREPLSRDQVLAPALAERWSVYPDKTINLTREENPVWVRFTVRNEAPGDQAWVLGIEWPMIDHIEFNARDPATGTWGAAHLSGLDAGAEAKILRDPAFMFPLGIPRGETRQYVMRVASHSAFLVPLLITQAPQFQQRRFDTAVLMGVLFGVIGVMFFYNLALSIFVREKSYAVYGVFLLTVLLYELTATGYGAMYLWADWAWLKRHDYEIFSSASFLAATFFFRLFLDLRNTRPAHLRQLNGFFLIFWMVAIVAAALWPSRSLMTLCGVVGLATSAVGIYASIVLSLQGNVYARYFLVAWGLVTAGTVATLLALLGVIDSNGFTDNAQHFGFAIESVLLSVALADRIKRERAAREAAQRETIRLTEGIKQEREEKIRAQEHAIALQARANEDLELRVLDRTAELERAMNNLEAANLQLATLSVTDGLTKVHNRRYFDDAFAKEFDRSARTGVPLALVMVDIDHFKRVNDTCGHLAGDECLRLVAAALRVIVCRSTDLIARYGGEEFALVLPGTDAASAVEMAERVRQAIEGINFSFGGKRIPISVSMGVVARVTSHAQGVADFLAEADAALYRAKEAGRNRVVLAEFA